MDRPLIAVFTANKQEYNDWCAIRGIHSIKNNFFLNVNHDTIVYGIEVAPIAIDIDDSLGFLCSTKDKFKRMYEASIKNQIVKVFDDSARKSKNK